MTIVTTRAQRRQMARESAKQPAALQEILRIQAECNAARPAHLHELSLIDGEEEARIRELIAAGTWPDGWDGDEPHADEWLKEHPHTSRMKKTKAQHEAEALEVASVAVFSILRDWIKGQVVAIETGILTFEGAFLGQILLPTGRTVLDSVMQSNMLPALEAPK